MCQLKRIRYKPNLHFRDFSIWPPLDIGKFFRKIGKSTVTLLIKFHVNSLYITIAMTF